MPFRFAEALVEELCVYMFYKFVVSWNWYGGIIRGRIKNIYIIFVVSAGSVKVGWRLHLVAWFITRVLPLAKQPIAIQFEAASSGFAIGANVVDVVTLSSGTKVS